MPLARNYNFLSCKKKFNIYILTLTKFNSKLITSITTFLGVFPDLIRASEYILTLSKFDSKLITGLDKEYYYNI